MRVTNKMADNYNVYNLNKNKALLDKLNTQMSTKKKYSEPMDNPVLAARSLHFRADLSEIDQFLGKNVTDAISWTDTTQTAIDTGKDILRSLKSEYTSAANGTNKNEDRWTYYNNMMNLVNEFYAVGNTTNENRYVFTGARTVDSFTFNEKNFDDRVKDIQAYDNKKTFTDTHLGTYKYVDIKEDFHLKDVESYSFTQKDDQKSTGITLEDIAGVNDIKTETAANSVANETNVKNVEAYRLRLSYENLDTDQGFDYKYYDEKGVLQHKTRTSSELKISVYTSDDDASPATYSVKMIENDYEISSLGKYDIYLNTTTGNLIFGEDFQKDLVPVLDNGGHVSISYNKSKWEDGDVKPEHYFDCVDVGIGNDVDSETNKLLTIVYDDHEQSIEYNVGDHQTIKINTNADRVFSLDAMRDLNEIRDALEAVDAAEEKVNKLKEMHEDSLRYSGDQLTAIGYLLNAAEKEFKYATEKVDKLYSNGMTKSQDYFDTANLAGTDMGTTVKRLTIIRNRLTENQTTITAQASDNENIDISTTAVDVNSATLSYGAALQVTGKISQQSLVNFL